MGEQPPERWRVAIIAVPNAMVSAVLGSLEVFAFANVAALGQDRTIDARVVSVSGEPVTGFAGTAVPVVGTLADVGELDAVVLPPLVTNPEDLDPEQRAVVEWVRGRSGGATTLGAACTGTFLLAETGALDGRRATTTPAFASLFRAHYPKVRLQTTLRVVDEGQVVTAGATTSYLDLALAMVARALGPRTALQTARILATDPNPRSQQPYLLPRAPQTHADDAIRTAEEWIAVHLGQGFDVPALAKHCGLSERSFTRRFRAATGEAPTEYVQRLRIEAAMQDLEGTLDSFEAITGRCGYGDVRSFRRLFARHTGLSPRDYRKRFGYAARER